MLEHVCFVIVYVFCFYLYFGFKHLRLGMFHFTYNLKFWDWFSRLNWNNLIISFYVLFLVWVSHELHVMFCIFICYMYCNTKFTRFLGSKNLLELKNIGFGYLVFILGFHHLILKIETILGFDSTNVILFLLYLMFLLIECIQQHMNQDMFGNV